jgi:hypothetical protein
MPDEVAGTVRADGRCAAGAAGAPEGAATGDCAAWAEHDTNRRAAEM